MQPRFRYSFPWITASAVILTLAACGKGGDPKQIYNQPVFHTESLTEAQQGALRTKVSCESQAQCSPSVGMLISTFGSESTGFGSCTASLISDSILVTNSHCIPDDLKTPGSECKGRIYMFFPDAEDYPAEQLDCQNVIAASEVHEGTIAQDYAFIQLSRPVARPVFKLNLEGFADQQKFYLNKVDPYLQEEGGPRFLGILRNVECKSVMNTVVLPEYFRKASPQVLLTECLVVHGNSGSSILDPDGQARGVVQAYFEKDTIKLPGLKLETERLSNLNAGTSFSCLRTPLDQPGRTFSSECFEHTEKLPIEADPARIQKQMIEIFKSVNWTTKDIFQWEVEEVAQELVAGGLLLSGRQTKFFSVVPKCFGDAAGWLHRFKSGFLKRTKKSARIPLVKLPVIEIGLVHDSYMRASVQPVLSSAAVQGEIDFSPRDVQTKYASRVVRSVFQFKEFKNRVVFDGELSICK